MTTAAARADGLAEFNARLRGGIYPAVRRNRPADQDERDRAALTGWPGDDLAPLIGIRSGAMGCRRRIDGDRHADRGASALTGRSWRPCCSARTWSST